MMMHFEQSYIFSYTFLKYHTFLEYLKLPDLTNRPG